jgi:hypothetical protein
MLLPSDARADGEKPISPPAFSISSAWLCITATLGFWIGRPVGVSAICPSRRTASTARLNSTDAQHQIASVPWSVPVSSPGGACSMA